MNQKRWLAVIIAGGLFLFSIVTSGMLPKTEDDSGATSLFNLLNGTDELTPTVIEEGNDSSKIARLSVDGVISGTSTSSIFSSGGYDHENFMAQIAAIKEDDTVKAVLLEVNSPGGGVYESAEIAKELKKLKEERDIPIYVSMTNLAASGGYYISANADKIFATEETTTGSIGVIMNGTNYSGLMEKLGIEDSTYKSGDLKDMGSSQRPTTEKDREVLQAYIDSAYGRFVTLVSEGRNMSEAEVKKLADGRIYDGAQAKEVGLVDEIGYPDDVLVALKKDYDLKGSQYVEYSSSNSSFMNSFLGSKWGGNSEESEISSLVKGLTAKEAPRAMYYYGGE